MKNSFAPIFTKILDSSLWEEPYTVRLLFVAMLALKDADHVVRYNDYQLHRRANLKLAEVGEALKILASPDQRRGQQEHEGRRIRKVADGWLVLNGQEYEEQMRAISRRVYQARKQREYREGKKLAGRGPLAGEATYLKTGIDVKEAVDVAVPKVAVKNSEPPEEGEQDAAF